MLPPQHFTSARHWPRFVNAHATQTILKSENSKKWPKSINNFEVGGWGNLMCRVSRHVWEFGNKFCGAFIPLQFWEQMC